MTDAAGNSTTATDSEDYSVDTVAPELGIDLDPIVVGGDNTVNKAEADDKAQIWGGVLLDVYNRLRLQRRQRGT
ncbi:hypothetical protein ACA545_03760 [Vibrio cholerae]